jgi:hypothetical protein
MANKFQLAEETKVLMVYYANNIVKHNTYRDCVPLSDDMIIQEMERHLWKLVNVFKKYKENEDS